MGRLIDFKKNLKEKKMSCQEWAQDQQAKVRAKNEKLNAFIEIYNEDFLNHAKEVDAGKRSGDLAGVSIGIKDIISIKDKELNAASKILKSYHPPRSATVVEKLERQGAIFNGRCNCDEFAMGSSNENSAFGSVKNPLDLARTTGGSSGGSAAVVAAEMSLASLGTDTGGSIRLPASFCGIVGMKPTYGRVSRSGVIAFASSLDQVGPFADDAADCAEVMQVISGRDSRDSTAMNVGVPDFRAALQNASLKGKTIGLPKEFFESEGLADDVRSQLDQSIEALKKEGVQFKPVSLPSSNLGIAVYYIVCAAEASSNLARYEGIRFGKRAESFESLQDLMITTRSEGFGDEVKRRLMLGTFCLSSGYYDAFYSKAQFVRSKIQSEFLSALKEVDFIFAPVAPTGAFKLGEKVSDPLQMYLMDIFTVPVSLAGLPSVAFPVGNTSENLPVGAQLIGKPFSEAELLAGVSFHEKIRPIKKGELQC